MSFIKQCATPAFRLGLRRAVKIWRHSVPPFPDLPRLDMREVLLPLPSAPSPMREDGSLLSREEAETVVDEWERELARVSSENEKRTRAWILGLHVGLFALAGLFILAVLLAGLVLVSCGLL